jgi:quercetin dioxygenase-like cupin family protein
LFSSTPFATGSLSGVVYGYDVDDTLPVHVHDEASNHITIIMAGSFRCIGNPVIEGKVLKTGQVVDWPANQPHGFVALENGSRMLQIAKGTRT